MCSLTAVSCLMNWVCALPWQRKLILHLPSLSLVFTCLSFVTPLSPVFISLSFVIPLSPVCVLSFVTPFHLGLPFSFVTPFTCVYLFHLLPPSPVFTSVSFVTLLSPVFTALSFVTPFHLCLPLSCVTPFHLCLPLSCVTPFHPCDPSLPVFSNGQMLLMVDGMKGFKVHGARMNREPFCLCGGKSETKKFFFTAQDIGKLPIYARVRHRKNLCVCLCAHHFLLT